MDLYFVYLEEKNESFKYLPLVNPKVPELSHTLGDGIGSFKTALKKE